MFPYHLSYFSFSLTPTTHANEYFTGYDLSKMVFNIFKRFAGEPGVEFSNKQRMRLMYRDVEATEEQLSHDSAGLVDVSNIEGLFKGPELLYGRAIGDKFYWSTAIGYYEKNYRHTELDDRIAHQSPL